MMPKNYALITAQSMGASFTSDAIPLTFYYGISVQAVWTGGSADGALTILVSNDNITYTTLTGSSATVSGAGDFFWDLTQTTAAYAKLSYTRNGGTGALSAQVNGKGV